MDGPAPVDADCLASDKIAVVGHQEEHRPNEVRRTLLSPEALLGYDAFHNSGGLYARQVLVASKSRDALTQMLYRPNSTASALVSPTIPIFEAM
ncbi:MAG: hypothetical protein Q8R28_05540 [Dehalococcoidia bacterium]|nr:hypothetical protein [Dehalococcoidia bacterium]